MLSTAKGLPPLPDPSKAPELSQTESKDSSSGTTETKTKVKRPAEPSLSFSSSSSNSAAKLGGTRNKKRKVLGDGEDKDDGGNGMSGEWKKGLLPGGDSKLKNKDVSSTGTATKKKVKKERKTLLSFGDEG